MLKLCRMIRQSWLVSTVIGYNTQGPVHQSFAPIGLALSEKIFLKIPKGSYVKIMSADVGGRGHQTHPERGPLIFTVDKFRNFVSNSLWQS